MPIEIKNLSYTYMPGTPFEHKAVDDLSLRIEDGEFVGIVGHTGSGKSTLIQILAGLLKGAEGTVLIDGKDIFSKETNRQWLRQTVGVVFQYPEYQLFEETVYKDVAYGPLKTGIDPREIESRVRVALGLVGLDYDLYKDKSPFELSGGQKRKAAIAGVLAMEPKILIMDEPIAGLDPQGRESLMDLVRDLNHVGTTILMISHNMDGLAEYATRVVMMHKSRLVMNGTPKEVFSDYEQVRRFGLDLPEAAKLAEKLRQRGFDIPRELIRYDEVYRWILEKLGGRNHA